MKRLTLILMALTFASLSYSYRPDVNEHIRFGVIGKKGTLLFRRGYVAMYDADKKEPVWVSYHLKRKYIENPLKPAFSFRPDPKLPSKQRAEVSDYSSGLYSRCRLANMGDMSRSKEVMKECFYLSNVCPMDQRLYTGLWRRLEEATRGFVKRGNDVWIITGPVFKQGKGKKQPIKTIGWSKIRVPSQFYKIIFYQAKDGSFNALGFVFANKKQQGDIRSYAVPVSEIEKMTGLTFLEKLPGEVGKLVKGKKPSGEKLADFFNIPVEKKQAESRV